MHNKLFLFLSLLSVFLALPGRGLAGGWDGAVLGPRAGAMGTAFAGLADDPSAIFYNPAGLALLREKQGLAATVRYNATWLKYRFPEDRTSPSGRDQVESYLSGVLPDLFYYRKFGPLAAGIGVYIPYGGLAGSWDPDAFGVDMNQFMAVASITPSLSWALTPWLSVGAGLNIYYGYMKSKILMDRIPVSMFGGLLPPSVTGLMDGIGLTYIPLKLRQSFHAKGPTLGYNVGVLFKPRPWLSLGVCMRSGADVTLNGSSDIVVYLADPLSLSFHSDLKVMYKLPYLVTGGLAVRPLPGLVLTADVNYGGWGRLSEITLVFEQMDFTQVNPTGYEDGVNFMVGLEYGFCEHYSVSLGYRHFPNNLKHEELLSYQSWDTTMNTFSFGFGYGWKNVSVHALGMVSVGRWNEKHFDDPGDPIGKPMGEYTTLFMTFGLGVLYHF